MKRLKDLPERITSRIQIADNGCWLWTGCTSSHSYGQVWYNKRQTSIHRLVYQHTHGPTSMCVLHKCKKQRNCCNPDHLYAGTHPQNMRDMVNDGTSCKGENQPDAKLTNEDAPLVRVEYAAGGVTQRELADKYGVSQQLISRIINRKIWKHL